MSDPAAILPIVDVRRLASSANLVEIQLNKNARVIAFRTPDGVRINVYYTTGTVGTYLDHPRMGRTQLFRRNVNMTLLGQIFRNPRVHTDLGYHWKGKGCAGAGGSDSAKGRGRSRTPRRLSSGGATASLSDGGDDVGEEVAAKAQLAKLKEEAAHVQGEIAAVQGIIDAFEAKRAEERRKAEEEERRKREEAAAKAAEKARQKAVADAAAAAAFMASQLAAARRSRGEGFTWAGLHESQFFHDNLAGVETVHVAIGGTSALAIFEGGGYSYTSGIPGNLYNKLHTRPAHAPPPVYCAMGSMDRYYIEFANGKCWANASDDCVEACFNPPGGRCVKSVAFGEDWDSYFIVYTDGWFEYKGVPSGLDAQVRARQSKPDLDFVGKDGVFKEN